MKKSLLIPVLMNLILGQNAVVDNPLETSSIDEGENASIDSSILLEENINIDSDTLAQEIESIITDLNIPLFSVPAGLDSGYKGINWGSSKNTSSINFASQDTTPGSPLIYNGKLGSDSVKVLFFFADSGFWKAEINFFLDQNDTDQEIKFFMRLENSISEVYGPALKTTQIQGGPGPAYANSIFPKFSRSFYRSTWYTAPVMIELLLNSMVLLPPSDLPVFNGKFSLLKLVYYNPDYQISSSPDPETETNPSIFDIY